MCNEFKDQVALCKSMQSYLALDNKCIAFFSNGTKMSYYV